MDVWQFGYSMLIFLSVIKQIPFTLYESAMVNRAKPSYTFIRIILPMLKLTIFFILILQIIKGFYVFTYFDMGYSCALVWILVAIIAFFIFLMVRFFHGIPRELDEVGEIDGCAKITTLFRILVPAVKPAIITLFIFAFYWIWQELFQQLIFMNSVDRFTISLALNMYLDPNSYNNYGGLFVMSMISLFPVILFFIIFQRYLVDRIAMAGIKG